MFDQCLYFNTVALARQLERLWTETFKPFDLTPSQAFALRAVLDKPGMLHSEMAETLRIARATATRSIDGLEKKGLLFRQSTQRDGRECEIRPTPEAVKLHSALDQASAVVTAKLKSELGAALFNDFVSQAKSISETID